MARPLVLIHGYSAEGLDFKPLAAALESRGVPTVDLKIGNYVSLNNEVTIKDIAEGLDRAFRRTPGLSNDEPFDAIVHSTGMLVIRSWLTNYGASVADNKRLQRLKHLIGVAPATWGSPQAHKGRTWLGALVKGNRNVGPDFLNAGDQVLDGLELGGRFTWDLAHLDLLNQTPYYGRGANTPFVCVFIGNRPYDGLASVANDPGTDGTVRWAGCALNARKIVVDLTRTPKGKTDGTQPRVAFSAWESDRLDVPMIPVEGRNHGTLISNPDPDMVKGIVDFLAVQDDGAHAAWLDRMKLHSEPAKARMLVNPGRGAGGLTGEAETYFGHFFHRGEQPLDGWQQFVVHARDERGDGVSDYLIDVLRQESEEWVPFQEMYTDVHAYGADPSYRCFHVRLPQGICAGGVAMKLRIHASTGTELMAYQGYGSADDGHEMKADAAPVEVNVHAVQAGGGLFQPFTTTLVEIILNREPLPLNDMSRIFKFL